MSEGPPGRDNEKGNLPDFSVQDRDLSIATWLKEGPHSLLPSSKLEKIYPDAEGVLRRTTILGRNDYLRAGKLWEKTNDRYLEYDQEYRRSLQEREHEERSPEPRRDYEDGRGPDKGRSRPRKRRRDR